MCTHCRSGALRVNWWVVDDAVSALAASASNQPGHGSSVGVAERLAVLRIQRRMSPMITKKILGGAVGGQHGV